MGRQQVQQQVQQPQQPQPQQQQQQSQSQQQQVKKRPSDPYYGHERTAVMASRFVSLSVSSFSPFFSCLALLLLGLLTRHFPCLRCSLRSAPLRYATLRQIISMFNCPNVPPASSVEPNAPLPTLAHFIAYALHRTRLPHFVTLVALLLLRRLKTRFPAARGSSGHRLFISAFMIASKVVCDDTYSNQSWCVVGQKMFSLKEMNQMEREMCGYLEWNLVSFCPRPGPRCF
jgi:hypothetical protein